jgi:hypothetical protein
VNPLAGLILFPLLLAAPAPDNVLSDAERIAGFKLIFDGKTLDGWVGHPKLWSVRDDAIVGETTKESPSFGNAYLVWKGGIVSDFELRFQFRLSGDNQGGVQYRGQDLGNGAVGGYQYVIRTGPESMGSLCDEKGSRKTLVLGGETLTWKDRKSLEGPAVAKDVLAAAEKPGEWNEGAVIGKGNQILHQINGVTVANLTDENEAGRRMRGVVALMVRSGPPVKVEFKNIRLKELQTNRGLPYDPSRHEGNPFYRSPEILSAATRSDLCVFWIDQDSKRGKSAKGYFQEVRKERDAFAVRRTFEVGLLQSLMGFTMDEQGNFYMATGIVEEGKDFPKPPVYRSDVIHILKISPQGKPLLKIDVQKEMEKNNPKTTIIQEPMTHGWSSSRLAYGNGTLHLVFGVSWTNGHQGACAAQFDAATGKVVREGSIYCSHTLDQRVVWDGTGFLEMQMGDAYPRAFVIGRYFREKGTGSYELFNPKTGGQQHSFSGSLAATPDPQFAYLANFAVEKSPDAEGYHELAVVRVKNKFESMNGDPVTKPYLDPSFPAQRVTVENTPCTNYVKWMTDASKDRMHVVKPKLVRVDLNRYVMLWEKWSGEPGDRVNGRGYQGTYGMVIDSAVKVIKPEKKLSDVQLVTSDDGVFLEGKAVFVSGSAGNKSLLISRIDKDLNFECAEVPAYKY